MIHGVIALAGLEGNETDNSSCKSDLASRFRQARNLCRVSSFYLSGEGLSWPALLTTSAHDLPTPYNFVGSANDWKIAKPVTEAVLVGGKPRERAALSVKVFENLTPNNTRRERWELASY
jgi:hypothetical protein